MIGVAAYLLVTDFKENNIMDLACENMQLSLFFFFIMRNHSKSQGYLRCVLLCFGAASRLNINLAKSKLVRMVMCRMWMVWLVYGL